MRVAIVGATGQVGGVMRQLLEQRNFPVDEPDIERSVQVLHTAFGLDDQGS